jgi:Na+-translocating ferredoxin:NAD+ oxidoreductase subunit D
VIGPTTERTDLILSTQPFLHEGERTPRIMREVTLVALVVLVGATWRFGLSAPLIAGAATAGAVGAEWFFTRHKTTSPLGDWSAILTGLLLGLTLPPAMPLWMAFLGGVAGVGLGKLIWGGLGQNAFNPALVGRAFLQAAFPTAITTWSAPAKWSTGAHVPSSLFAPPFMHGEVDAISAATPLGLAKFEHEITGLGDLFVGSTAGSLGETSAVLLIVCGLWLGLRGLFDWRLPVSTVLSTAVFAQLLHFAMPEACPDGAFMALSGGLLFGAVFMVTDPVTTPTTAKGAWIFGVGVGFLVVLIRNFGGLPEGVMYAILLMNAATPHIERFTQPRPFGG